MGLILNLFIPLPSHFQLNLNSNTERVNSLYVTTVQQPVYSLVKEQMTNTVQV